MNLIAAYAHSTRATGLKRLKTLALMAALALAGPAHAAYVKIANNGTDLPDSAVLGTNPADWACTLDTATGLVWEVKTPANNGLGYTNYDSSYPDYTNIIATTNSIGYVYTVNMASLCGAATWRMPSKDELIGLVVPGSDPTINTSYFPNTASWLFWSGSPDDSSPGIAWFVSFLDGYAGNTGRSSGGFSVRLVRGGQSFDPLTVLATGTGSGSVDRSSWGAVCSRTNAVGCNSSVMWPKRGSSVTLTATPAAGSALAGWGGACSGTSATCTVTMDAAKGVTAEFTPISTSAIVIDPATPTTLYAGLDGGGVWKKVGAGNWTAATTQPSNLNVKALAIASTGTTLYAGTDGGGVFKSSNSGVDWAVCKDASNVPNSGLTNLNLRSLALTGTTLYAGTTAGVFVSTDGCTTWTAMNAGLPPI